METDKGNVGIAGFCSVLENFNKGKKDGLIEPIGQYYSYEDSIKSIEKLCKEIEYVYTVHDFGFKSLK